MGNDTAVPLNNETELPYNPANSLLDTYPKDPKVEP